MPQEVAVINLLQLGSIMAETSTNLLESLS